MKNIFVVCSLILALTVLGGAGPVSNRSEDRGRKIWFENTYGGEKFFSFLANHPDASKRVNIGFEKVLLTPRKLRFQNWGTINDPDCHEVPGEMDSCKDPSATGVIGIRKSTAANGKILYGVACASCHAGFDPLRPPKDVNEPKWENIHPSIGNQYLDSGKIFAAEMVENDLRRIMFAAWPKGTVDTTLLFNDNIMNPGVMTAFWNVPHRPTFDVGMSEEKNRGGQGGEDDVGGDLAALRVYTNIGVCFQECVASRPGQPISINECRKSCADFPPQKDLNDLVVFMRSIKSPRYPEVPPLREYGKYSLGRKVFRTNCASCHDDSGRGRHILSNDEINPIAADPQNATNLCRVLTTNWEEGKLWSEFSSQLYKDRIKSGNRGYRTVPLAGIWSTAPFLHNQSVGKWAPPDATPARRAAVFEISMRELLSEERRPKVNRLPIAVGPFPQGTPLTQVFSRDTSGNLLCDDIVENRGHYYGSKLSAAEKDSLIFWLKYQ